MNTDWLRTPERCDCIPGLDFLRGRTSTYYGAENWGTGGECPPVESGSKVRTVNAHLERSRPYSDKVHRYLSNLLSPLSDAYLALERLENYRGRLNRAEDEELKKALDRAIAAIRTKLFQALLGKWCAREANVRMWAYRHANRAFGLAKKRVDLGILAVGNVFKVTFVYGLAYVNLNFLIFLHQVCFLMRVKWGPPMRPLECSGMSSHMVCWQYSCSLNCVSLLP